MERSGCILLTGMLLSNLSIREVKPLLFLHGQLAMAHFLVVTGTSS